MRKSCYIFTAVLWIVTAYVLFVQSVGYHHYKEQKRPSDPAPTTTGDFIQRAVVGIALPSAFVGLSALTLGNLGFSRRQNLGD
jgi:hypothetical protein